MAAAKHAGDPTAAARAPPVPKEGSGAAAGAKATGEPSVAAGAAPMPKEGSGAVAADTGDDDDGSVMAGPPSSAPTAGDWDNTWMTGWGRTGWSQGWTDSRFEQLVHWLAGGFFSLDGWVGG